MNTFRKGLDLLLGAICCLVLAIMVGIACWQVVSRYILGVPSTLTEEMLRFLLVWVSMLGMAFVAGQKQHISLTILLDKVSPTIRGWWDIILQVIFIRVFHLGIDYRRLKDFCDFYAANLPCAGHSDGENLLRAPLRGHTDHPLWATEYR